MTCQKYIFKIHSSRIRSANWDLVLPVSEARRNDEVISLADSQILRWIDELNEIYDADEKAREIKSKIRQLKKEDNSIKNRRTIRKLYSELDDIQFKPDYMCLIIDKEKDYYRACEGFSINGVRYCRLLGTNGGVKNSTIVFVSERLAPELRRRIDNDRDMTVPLVPAKLEAYKALTCSASVPVSMPDGILIVKDCSTSFKSDVMYLSDENDGEPTMELRKNEDVSIKASDGCGMMLPSLAEKWSAELGLNYMVSGLNTRFSFEKGMIYTFDFVDFANKVSHNYIVKDAWGNDVDIRSVEIILTTSMVKLWDCYKSCDDYLRACSKNKYTFGVAKTCPKSLESERCLNYQFIQSYDLDDSDIEELIAPTMNEIKDVLGGDYRKSIIFLKGYGLTEDNMIESEDGYAKALMIDKRMIQDPYVRNCIYQLIKNRIKEAKVGVLRVHGNYSIVSGDPYALCQSMFGMDVTGLLKAGEVYNKYWLDAGADALACFRAPMTSHRNIRKVSVARGDDVEYWYQYMRTCTIFNAWDCCMDALNGMDFDGDLVMLTDNNVLVSKMKPLPTLMCVQRRAAKKIATEEDMIKSNIESFGNDIGKTTNWITSMFDVRSRFPVGSEEYNILSYRIDCGQLYQQNAIDKAKGIIAKPMPRDWHDRHAANGIEQQEKRALYREIVADKKPYFMRYIYPDLMKQYNDYIKNTDKSCLREFHMRMSDLLEIPECNLSQEQAEFLKHYRYRMPVGVGSCVMNKICKRFEQEFDGCLRGFCRESDFDYSIMKSDTPYFTSQYNAIKRLYDEYRKRVQDYTVFEKVEKVDKDEAMVSKAAMLDDFSRSCHEECQNSDALCNIILDMCYGTQRSKKFAWDMCSDIIIKNLLSRNNQMINAPVISDDGDIEYGGCKFKMISRRVEE